MDRLTSAPPARSPPAAAGYDLLAVILHWAMAGLILANLALAAAFPEAEGPGRGALIRLHKSIGLTVLGLALLRLAWALVRPRVAPLEGLGPAARRLAAAVHAAFYVLMIAMPLSGWAMISADSEGRPTRLWGLVPWPRIGPLTTLAEPARDQVHTVLAVVHLGLGLAVAGLVAVHVAGAVLHQLAAREPALRRMAPRLGRRRPG